MVKTEARMEGMIVKIVKIDGRNNGKMRRDDDGRMKIVRLRQNDGRN